MRLIEEIAVKQLNLSKSVSMQQSEKINSQRLMEVLPVVVICDETRKEISIFSDLPVVLERDIRKKDFIASPLIQLSAFGESLSPGGFVNK